VAKYSCKNCGAELFFDPKSGKLHCDYCGSDFDPSEYAYVPETDQAKGAAKDQTVKQGLSEDEINKAKQDGMSEQQAQAAAGGEKATDDSTGDLVVYKCPNCGAEVITSKDTAATTCVYCNRAITLEGNISGQFRPDYVVPFAKTQDEVEAAYHKLCRSSILTPKAFSDKKNIKKIKGMYIPYWLYSFKGDAEISVLGKNIRMYTLGDNEYTETSSYQVDEEVTGNFEHIPADALKKMDNTLMDSIEPFDFSKMKPFNPAYLAGFYTQRWDDKASDNEARAKERAKASLHSEALSKAGNFDETTVRSENFKWSEDKTESAMMPVWMMYTEYKGKNYIFGMNGQTGKLMGEIPKSLGRILGILGGVFVITQIILMIVRVLGVIL
jgi:DNA-directed RNA polymerase subunit RPC12/RpoP